MQYEMFLKDNNRWWKKWLLSNDCSYVECINTYGKRINQYGWYAVWRHILHLADCISCFFPVFSPCYSITYSSYFLINFLFFFFFFTTKTWENVESKQDRSLFWASKLAFLRISRVVPYAPHGQYKRVPCLF